MEYRRSGRSEKKKIVVRNKIGSHYRLQQYIENWGAAVASAFTSRMGRGPGYESIRVALGERGREDQSFGRFPYLHCLPHLALRRCWVRKVYVRTSFLTPMLYLGRFIVTDKNMKTSLECFLLLNRSAKIILREGVGGRISGNSECGRRKVA